MNELISRVGIELLGQLKNPIFLLLPNWMPGIVFPKHTWNGSLNLLVTLKSNPFFLVWGLTRKMKPLDVCNCSAGANANVCEQKVHRCTNVSTMSTIWMPYQVAFVNTNQTQVTRCLCWIQDVSSWHASLDDLHVNGNSHTGCFWFAFLHAVSTVSMLYHVLLATPEF